MNANNQNPSPYGSGDPYYNESSGFITPHSVPRKRVSPWIKFGIPVLVIVIIAAVVGGVVGSRKSSTRSSSSSSGGGSSGDSAAAASSAASAKLAIGRFATATNSEFEVPLYPSTVRHCFVFSRGNYTHMYLRLTQLHSRHQHSFLPAIQKLPGLKILSTQLVPTFLTSVQTDHGSSPPLTNGTFYPL